MKKKYVVYRVDIYCDNYYCLRFKKKKIGLCSDEESAIMLAFGLGYNGYCIEILEM